MALTVWDRQKDKLAVAEMPGPIARSLLKKISVEQKTLRKDQACLIGGRTVQTTTL